MFSNNVNHTHVKLDTAKDIDKNSTLGKPLTQEEKSALKDKIEQSRQENQRKIQHPMLGMAPAMSGVAIAIIVFMVAGMTGHPWTSPFVVFKFFTNPYVLTLCIASLIIVAVFYLKRKLDHNATRQ